MIGLVFGGTSLLAVSGTDTTVAAPGSPRNATTQTLSYAYGAISDIPSAKWVWDGPGDAFGCYLNIMVTHSFTIACLNVPLKVSIRADDRFWFSLNGQTYNIPTYKPLQNYTFATTNVSCGNKPH